MPDENTGADPMTATAKDLQATADKASKTSMFEAIEAEFNQLPSVLKDKASAGPDNLQETMDEKETPPTPVAKKDPAVLPNKDDHGIPDEALDPTKAKKDETVEVDKEKFIADQAKGMSPKAADRFRGIADRAFQAETRLKEAQAKLTDLEAKFGQPNPDAVKELQAKIDEYDSIIQKSNLEAHPKFKAHYDGAIEKEVALAKGVVPKEHQAEIDILLRMPDSKVRNEKLKEIIQDLRDDPIAVAKLNNAVYSIDKLAAEKQEELSNWKANKSRMEKLSVDDSNASAERFKADTERAFTQIMRSLADPKDGIEIFRKVEGNAVWNAKVDGHMAEVRKMAFADLGRDDVVAIASQAVMGKEYRNLFLQQMALTSRLKKELADIKASSAGLGDGGDGGGSGGDLDDKMSFTDRMVAMAKNQGLVR